MEVFRGAEEIVFAEIASGTPPHRVGSILQLCVAATRARIVSSLMLPLSSLIKGTLSYFANRSNPRT